MKKYYSMEYIDSEGDTVIKSSFLTEEELKVITDEFCDKQISFSIYNITPEQVVDNVISVDEENRKLGGSS